MSNPKQFPNSNFKWPKPFSLFQDWFIPACQQAGEFIWDLVPAWPSGRGFGASLMVSSQQFQGHQTDADADSGISNIEGGPMISG